MGVDPALKGAFDLVVDELSAFDVVLVVGLPGDGEGTFVEFHDADGAVLDASFGVDGADVVPGRGEALESPVAGVPVVEGAG